MNTIFLTKEEQEVLTLDMPPEEHLKLIKKYILQKPDLKVLDLGCGAGDYLISFKNENDPMCRYEKLVGVDNLSNKFYGIFHPKELNKLGIEFIESDALNFLESHNDSYDLIICINLLHFFPIDQILKLIRKSIDRLNDGGTLYIKMANGNHEYSKDSSMTVYDDSLHNILATDFTIDTIYYLEYHIMLIIKK